MRDEHQERVSRAIQACRDAGLPVIDRESCTCGLRGQLVVLARPDGLRVLCPYDQPCPVHGSEPGTQTSAPNAVTAGSSRAPEPPTRSKARAS